MRTNVLGAALVMALAVPTLAANVGEEAPGFEGSEYINTPALTWKKLKGRVIFYEVFRTW